MPDIDKELDKILEQAVYKSGAGPNGSSGEWLYCEFGTDKEIPLKATIKALITQERDRLLDSLEDAIHHKIRVTTIQGYAALQNGQYVKVPNIEKLIASQRTPHMNDIDRIEVIDETGRAYVRGSIYGSPVTVKLDYQDDGRTLKVFVEPNHDRSDGHVCSDCFDNGKGTYDRYGLAEKGTEE